MRSKTIDERADDLVDRINKYVPIPSGQGIRWAVYKMIEDELKDLKKEVKKDGVRKRR